MKKKKVTIEQIFIKFLKESIEIMDKAIKEMDRKYPDLLGENKKETQK